MDGHHRTDGACPVSTTAVTSNGLSMSLFPPVSNAPPSDADPLGDQRLSILQQAYQQKQMELLQHFQRAQANLALQHLTYFQALQQTTPQQPANADATANGSPDMLASPSGAGGPIAPAGMRQRRAYSGSGSTISENTRERLKSMIAIKRRMDAPGPAPANPQITSSTHFEPYPIHIAATIANGGASATPHSNGLGMSATEFQLRKVNSEPNLKMRIRAKLLNKGQHGGVHQLVSSGSKGNVTSTSPVLPASVSPHTPHFGAFSFPPQHRALKRSDSDSTATAMDVAEPYIPRLVAPAPKYAHMMVPSPSLPNLPVGLGAGFGSGMPFSLDATTAAMMAQVALTGASPYLSMPSLLQGNPLFAGLSIPPSSLLSSTNSIDGHDSDESTPPAISIHRSDITGGSRVPVKFDNRSFTSPLPVGGYPSLLKQQLRDLVLRRKSLVREEPEDDGGAAGAICLSSAHADRLNKLANGAIHGLKTGLAYDSAMSKHQCVCGDNKNHVEHGGRVHSIWARLQERGLVDACERVNARKAPLDLLRLVHSDTYVTFFAVSPTACLKIDPAQLPLRSFVQLPCNGIGVDSDTYFNDANTQLATRISVGSLVELCSQVAEGKLRNGFAVIRPPGHHAERDQAMGFCFFNNVAIAARHLQQRYGDRCRKIAIIDWDVHHGNGTQLCFESDPNILYLSLHRHDNGNFFPGTGAVTEVGQGAGKGFTLNIPFSGDTMGDAEYLAAWRVVVAPVLREFDADFILVSAGFDGAKGHPSALGGYELSPQLFGYLTSQLMRYADGRVVLALEGGYDLAAISDSAEECVKVLCEFCPEAGRLSAETMNAIPKASAQETIQKVVAIHKKHWTSLTGSQGLGMSEASWEAVSNRFASLTVEASTAS